MSKHKYVELLDFTIGLYEEGLHLLEPDRKDFSIISGCILLLIGFEKFIKYVLEKENPLMVLKTIKFEDVLAVTKGVRIGEIERQGLETVGLEKGFEQLVDLFPNLDKNKEKQIVKELVKFRNLLIHNTGCLDLNKIELSVRIKIAEISETICQECLHEQPRKILGKELWDKMETYKEAYKEEYKQANILDLNQRIGLFKRIYATGKKLPCEDVNFSENSDLVKYECPICKNIAEIVIEWEVDLGEDGTILNGWNYFNALKCSNCGFTLTDPEDIDNLIPGKIAKKLLDANRNKYSPSSEENNTDIHEIPIV